MKILNWITSYNQLRFLPYVLDHQKKLGCELSLIDLGSTDGSIEWLERRRIPYEKIDPSQLEEWKKEQTQKIRPDWVMESTAAEMVVLSKIHLFNILDFAASKGITTLKCSQLDFFSMEGGSATNHPVNSFFYYEQKPHRELVKKESMERRSSLIEGYIFSYQGDLVAKEDLKDARNLEAFQEFSRVQNAIWRENF